MGTPRPLNKSIKLSCWHIQWGHWLHLAAPDGRHRGELKVSLVLGDGVVDADLVKTCVDLHTPTLRVLPLEKGPRSDCGINLRQERLLLHEQRATKDNEDSARGGELIIR